MNVMEAFPSKYLKAEDLQGKEITVQIDRIAMEEVGKTKDMRPILYFRGKQKGIVLNKTNSKNVAKAYGAETDAWIGQAVVLYSAWVDFNGESVEAIRVRPAAVGVKPPVAKPTPSDGNSRDEMEDEVPF